MINTGNGWFAIDRTFKTKEEAERYIAVRELKALESCTNHSTYIILLNDIRSKVYNENIHEFNKEYEALCKKYNLTHNASFDSIDETAELEIIIADESELVKLAEIEVQKQIAEARAKCGL